MIKLVIASTALLFGSSLVHAQASPEQLEYDFRSGIFDIINFKSAQMTQAKDAGDQAAFQGHAADMAYLAGLITEGFQIENSVPDNSLALPSIWEDFEDFSEKASNLQAAAQALADSGDMDAFNARSFGGENCGACHREYRARR